MKDNKYLMFKFFGIWIFFIFAGNIYASGADTLKSVADFYIASTKGDISFDQSEDYYLNAINVYAETEKDCEYLVLSCAYLADYYRFAGHLENAQKYIKMAGNTIPKCKIRNEYLSEYYKAHASVYNSMGKKDTAFQSYTKAISLLITNGDTLPQAAMSLFKKGLFFQNRSVNDSAEIYFEAAWRHVQQKHKETNIYHLTIISSLATIYQTTAQLNKCIEANQKVVQISKEHNINQSWYVPGSYITLGSIYWRRGEPEKAKAAYTYALNMSNDNYPIYRARKASTLYNLGLLHQSKSEYSEALSYFKDAFQYEKDLWMGTTSALLISMADVYYYLDSLDRAAEYYQKSIDFSRESYGMESTKTAKMLLSAAKFYEETSPDFDVFPYLKKAYNIYLVKDPDHPRAMWCRMELGDYYRYNQPDSSLWYYNEAISVYPPLDELLKETSQSSMIKYSVNKELIFLLQKKGQLLFEISGTAGSKEDKADILKNSLHVLDTSIRLLEKYRNSLSLESSKIFVNSYFKSITETAIMACRQLVDYEEEEKYKHLMYNYIERYKAAVLATEIAAASADNDRELQDTLFLLEKRYRRDIAALESYLYNKTEEEANSPTALIANEQIIKLHQKQEEITEAINQRYPGHLDLRNKQEIAGVKNLQAVLGEDDCIADYFITDSCLITCYASKDEFKIDFKSIDEEFTARIQQLNRQTRDPHNLSFSRTDIEEYVVQLGYLGDILLDSMMLNRKNLIIIPDADLSTLPFGILLSNKTSEVNSLTELPYLIKSYVISYDYSAGLYFKNLVEEEKVIPKVGGFAPVYNFETEENLPVLKASAQEVVDIARYFDVEAFFRYEASKTRFKDQQEDFSILHLAMHTYIDSQNPSFTSLIFAPDTMTNADYMLNVMEIYNMRITAGLSVLSGCNSGFGKLSAGEGLLSLARAFYLAGSHSIVMNLWQVEDKVSKQIFDRFYFHLSEGYGRGEALRLAKLDFLQNADPRFHHPHYWGGFVLIGQKGPFLSSFGTRQLVLLIGIFISAILVVVVIRKANRKK